LAGRSHCRYNFKKFSNVQLNQNNRDEAICGEAVF